MNIIYPFGWRIIRREVRDSRLGWAFERPSLFYNLLPIPAPDLQSLDMEKAFGLTKAEVVTEIFKINGGKLGFYLVNLPDRKYYYCGTTTNDLKSKLAELGIGSMQNR